MVMVVQSTSPFHAKSAFMSIGKLLLSQVLVALINIDKMCLHLASGDGRLLPSGRSAQGAYRKIERVSNALPWVTFTVTCVI